MWDADFDTAARLLREASALENAASTLSRRSVRLTGHCYSAVQQQIQSLLQEASAKREHAAWLNG
jgi:hypothetical protein